VNSKDQLTLFAILEAARWAVSADNGQPWKFCWKEGRLLLLMDSDRARSFFDGRLYAPYLGFGSLIENLHIAARHLGFEPQMELFPGSEMEHEQLVASISFVPSAAQANLLYPAIFERTTNRRAYFSKAIPLNVQTAVLKSSEGFRDFKIVLVDEVILKNRLAALTAGAEAIRFNFSQKDVHADFYKCLRFTQAQARKTADGLWVRCLEVGLPEAIALRFLANWPFAALAARLGTHRAFSHQSVHLLRRTPLIALVIAGNCNSQLRENDFLIGGRLCQRLWLTATVHHLACQPMAALPLFFLQHAGFGDKGFPGQSGKKIGRLREEFSQTFKLAQGEEVLMVFRLGYAESPSAQSLRRPLSELLEFSDDSPIVAHS
jgi:nitroreductase